MDLPGVVGDFIIILQIGVFIFTGVLAVLIDKRATTWVMAVSAVFYGLALFSSVFVRGVTLRGWPSLFLLVFMGALLYGSLRDRARNDVKDRYDH